MTKMSGPMLTGDKVKESDPSIDVVGPSLPSFTTRAYYQALSQDERQYGAEAEYRQQFYNFIEQLYNDIYDAIVSGRDTITRGDKYEPYKDSATLAAPVDAFFDEIFGDTGTVSVADVLENDLFSQAVTEYNYAPGEFDFAAGWSQLQNAEQMQESAQKQRLWETQLLPALEAGGDFVKTAIFGPAPSGGPKSIDEIFEEWMDTTLDQMKGPLTVTVDPEGLSLEIMIPVGFEVNGEPLKIEIFDEDGNFVGVQEIGQAVWNGTWGVIEEGVFKPISEIFDPEDTDTRTTIERIFDAAESVIVQTGLGGVEQGGWLGQVLGEEVRRQLGFNEETNTIEGIEEGSLDPDSDLMGEDPTGTASQDPVDADNDGIDDNTGLPLVEDPEEETEASSKPPPGRAITDKDGNVLYIDGDDGNLYVKDEQGNWVVQPEGEGDGADQFTDTTVEGTLTEEDRVAYLSDIDNALNNLDMPSVRTDEDIQALIDAAIQALPDDAVRTDEEINALIEEAVSNFLTSADLPEDQVRTDEEIQALIDASLIQDTVRSDEEINDLISTALEDYIKAEDLPEDQVRTDEEIQALIDAALGAIPEDTTRTDDEINELISAALGDLVLPEDTTRSDEEIQALIDASIAGLEDQVRTDEEIQDLINASISDFLTASDLPEDQVRTDEEIQGLIDAALSAIPEDTTRSDDEINDLITAAIDNLDLPEDTTRTDEEINALIDAALAGLPEDQVRTDEEIQDLINASISDFLTASDLPEDQVRTDEEIQGLINAALDAIPEDTTRSDDEINTLISAAIGNLNLPEDTTRSDEEIQALIDASVSNFTTADQVTDIVNDVLLASGLTDLNDLSEEDVQTIVEDIVGSPEDASGLYGFIDNLNDLSEDDVTRIVTTALGGLENISSNDVSNIVTGIIGSPEDASGLYGAISDVSTQVSTLDTDLNNRIDALVDAGVTRADAVDQALADLAIANQTTEEAILAQIGTTEGALRADITDVGASVEALAETVGQDTQYDDQGNVVTEATGIFAEFDNLIDQGANEYEALTTAISNVSDQVGTTEETLFGAIQDSENRLSDIIGSPSVSDDPNTSEDETIPATGIYADIEQSTSDISSAVGSAIGGMGGFEKFMGGFDYSPAQFVAVEYQPRKDYMVELDRMIDEGFKDVFNNGQKSMFGDMI